MTTTFTESTVEEAALELFIQLGYAGLSGPTIAHGELFAERGPNYDDVILVKRLRQALERLNPKIPPDALDDVVRRIQRTDSASLIVNNRQFHTFLLEGVPVEHRERDGRTVHGQARLIDFDKPDNNDWLAVNQFTIIENRINRRPDIVVFINGLPLVLFEMKNLADEDATVRDAYNQFQTYKRDIPSIFTYNAVLVISDGIETRIGTLTSGFERFMPWRTIEGTDVAPRKSLELEVLMRGALDKRRFLDLLRHFIVFEDTGKSIEKKLAGYHQFHAVNKAVECTVAAASPRGDRRVGVVWHTQGSGKSLTMAFYAGKIIQHPAMSNPTLVMLTDRNDLDEQLFDTFAACKDLLRQKPEQAQSRDDLHSLLHRSSGGVIFTTIQKFFPETKGAKFPPLSDRRNIVVIADEAHRSQYGFIEGFAKHIRDALPGASFIGFTATPIQSDDRSTRAVFGDYIDVYDLQQSVEDHATVPIYYEGRLAKLDLKEDERPRIDPDFEEVTEGEEKQVKEKLKTKWARMEAMVGTERRLRLVAEDIVAHYEQREIANKGKALIVCMSRRICVELYDQIVKLRPAWHSADDEQGAIKIVMTGSADDDPKFQPHIRNKKRREALANRFKDAADPLKLVIVRDMWLTGFDVPSLHTMYVDKPMQSHGLMQAIARVNRVFGEKEGGLVVDYLGLATQLQKAVANYTESGGKGTPVFDQEAAVAKMRELFEIAAGMMHGFDYSKYKTGSPLERNAVIPAAREHILQQDAKDRFMGTVSKLSKAFALSVPHQRAMEIRDDVGFLQTVRAGIAKLASPTGKAGDDLDIAVRQIVSRAVASDEVIDIFSAAGLKRPDLSILSEEFLSEVKDLPHKNLAFEALRKLLNDEIKARARKNLVQSRLFSAMLEETIHKYQNRSLQAAEVIQELIELARKMRLEQQRGNDLGLSEDEKAFYDALETNDSAVAVLGDDTLKKIALELLDTVRNNATIDWTEKESVRARLRAMVRRILRKYGYPPDKQEKATQTVLEQAELLCKDLAA
ncbi:MAG: type I restriction endonuclease subunit R [Candidatus Acidiferrales bacterium]